MNGMHLLTLALAQVFCSASASSVDEAWDKENLGYLTTENYVSSNWSVPEPRVGVLDYQAYKALTEETPGPFDATVVGRFIHAYLTAAKIGVALVRNVGAEAQSLNIAGYKEVPLSDHVLVCRGVFCKGISLIPEDTTQAYLLEWPLDPILLQSIRYVRFRGGSEELHLNLEGTITAILSTKGFTYCFVPEDAGVLRKSHFVVAKTCPKGFFSPEQALQARTRMVMGVVVVVGMVVAVGCCYFLLRRRRS